MRFDLKKRVDPFMMATWVYVKMVWHRHWRNLAQSFCVNELDICIAAYRFTWAALLHHSRFSKVLRACAHYLDRLLYNQTAHRNSFGAYDYQL